MTTIEKDSSNSCHTTFHELVFLHGLGRHREHVVGRTNALPLLRNYLASIPGRVNWGQINPVQVQARVEELIVLAEREQRGGTS